jgi:translation initiation factor 5B
MFNPIISVVGHVDVGKTSFLDYFTSNKTKEVNNITQEIRMQEYSSEQIKNKFIVDSFAKNFNLNGVVFIDTPGHDYFESQRRTTTKLSSLAILIIDIVYGLNKTHIEILNYFKSQKIDFIIILNKIDTIFEWNPQIDSYLKASFSAQSKPVMKKLNDYMNNIICQLAEQEINAVAYYSNTDYKTFTSIVPLSAKSGEGIMDCMLLISKLMMKKYEKLSKNPTFNNINGYLIDQVNGMFGKGFKYIHTKPNNDAHILMSGTTIDIHNKNSTSIKHILKNSIKIDSINTPGIYTLILDNTNYDCGDIFINDSSDISKIDFVSMNNCNLLSLDSVAIDYNDDIDNTDNTYNNSKKSKNSQHDDQIELSKNGIGIITVSKSMEKPLKYMFDQMNIQVSLISNEKLSKNHIIKVCNNNKSKDKLTNTLYDKYRVIVIFDPSYSTNGNKVISDEIEDFAKKNMITLLFDQTIYKLKNLYENYLKGLTQKIKSDYKHLANIKLEILPQFMFLKSSPLLFGVKVKKGVLNIGTNLVAVKDDKKVILGKLSSIHYDKEVRDMAKVGEQVCIRIESISDKKIVYKVDFDDTYEIQTFLSKDDMKVYEMFKNEIESY